MQGIQGNGKKITLRSPFNYTITDIWDCVSKEMLLEAVWRVSEWVSIHSCTCITVMYTKAESLHQEGQNWANAKLGYNLQL